jgi:carbamoyltransferase
MSKPTTILGISALYHDAAAALLQDGRLVAAAQEERFSRVKHDPSLPVKATRWCLSEAGIGIGDVDWLVFYEKPLRKFERILSTSVATFPRSWRAFPRYMQTWLGDKLWTRNKLTEAFGVQADRILFSEHHLSHAASAFLCSPHREAAILTVDGVGELATTGLWRGTESAPFIEPVAEVRFPHSIGMLYSALTAWLGFAVNEGEYKVMGLASFGEPRYRAEIDKLLTLSPEGGFALNLDFFSYHWHPTESYTQALVDLLGKPRFPGSPFVFEGTPGATAEAIAETKRFADVAASLQQATEDALLHLAKHAHEAVGGDALCMAGGVALNSVANHRVAAESPFKHIWIQPAAGDAGGALGAALWAWHCVLGKPREQAPLSRPDLGRRWSRAEVKEYLDDLELDYEDFGSAEAGADKAAEELARGGVIGWVEGGFEWGPRALGHRSILADPRTAEMKDTVNRRIKFREPFRPFAPAITEEAVDDWFELPKSAWEPASFMLLAVPVKEEKKAQIPATTHVDGTARLQLVREADSPVFYRLIKRFGEETGVPVVLNTSFNLKGEPIASSPVDALATLMRCELDALYIEGFRVLRSKRLSGEAPFSDA